MNQFQYARQLWDRDPVLGILYARLHRSDLPSDLLERVASRHAKLRQQAEQIRDAREINYRVDAAMQALGGAQSSLSAGMPSQLAPFDARQQMFELAMALATQQYPDLATDRAGAMTLEMMEDVLLGRATSNDLLGRLLPAERYQQYLAQMEVLKMVMNTIPGVGPLLALIQAAPRLGAALSLPEVRLAPIAGALGIT